MYKITHGCILGIFPGIIILSRRLSHGLIIILVLSFSFSGEPGGRLIEFYKSRKENLGLSVTAGPNGSLTISYIQPGSAAGKAPLRIGDRVLTVNGAALQDIADAQVNS